jgi:hypothetical protein
VHRRHLRLSFLLRACSLCNPPAERHPSATQFPYFVEPMANNCKPHNPYNRKSLTRQAGFLIRQDFRRLRE